MSESIEASQSPRVSLEQMDALVTPANQALHIYLTNLGSSIYCCSTVIKELR